MRKLFDLARVQLFISKHRRLIIRIRPVRLVRRIRFQVMRIVCPIVNNNNNRRRKAFVIHWEDYLLEKMISTNRNPAQTLLRSVVVRLSPYN